MSELTTVAQIKDDLDSLNKIKVRAQLLYEKEPDVPGSSEDDFDDIDPQSDAEFVVNALDYAIESMNRYLETKTL